MFPIFFSVSSDDEAYARSVWEALPADWVYLYSETGEEGVEMWDEISRKELPQAKYFVVFWSKSYAKANGCIRELNQAAELSDNGTLSSLIIRLDDYPITWDEGLPHEQEPVFKDLGRLLAVRTSRANMQVADARHLVQRIVEPVVRSTHPHFNRTDALTAMRDAAQMERFKCFPAMWISGFPGSGRTTLIADLNGSMAPNGRAIQVEINAASLPKQVALKLESQGLGADVERLKTVQDSEDAEKPSGVAQRIERIFEAGNYVILRHTKILQNNTDVPEWIDEAIKDLTAGARTKLFVVSQMPASIDHRKECLGQLSELRVPGFYDHEIVSFAESLIAFFDRSPERWTADAVSDLIEAAQGNFGLLVTLTQAASSLIDLSEISDLISHARSQANQSIAYYVDWAFSTLGDDIECQRILLFLNDVSPCDPNDLAEVLDSERSILSVLAKCMKLGFVERDDGGLYRLTPFLAGRLARHLVRNDLVDWRREVIEKFASSPIDFESSDNDYIRIESRIQASFWAGKAELPETVEKFVSASHWFQAGVRLYHVRQYKPAYRILKKAFEKRDAFSDASRTELTRYFGLASIRNDQVGDAATCISLLKGDRRTQEIAAYLEAFQLEEDRKYIEARNKYIEALELNQGKSTRLERIYRPLIRCILLTRYPDFRMAEEFALDWADLRETVFTKYSLARIYLLWKHKGPAQRDPLPSDLDECYEDALQALENHPGGQGAYHEILSEAAELAGDLPEAVRNLELSIDFDDRFQLRLKRWQLLARMPEKVESVLSELEALKADSRHASFRDTHMKDLVEIFVSAMNNGMYSANRLNKFAAPLPSREIGKIVARVNRRAG